MKKKVYIQSLEIKPDTPFIADGDQVIFEPNPVQEIEVEGGINGLPTLSEVGMSQGEAEKLISKALEKSYDNAYKAILNKLFS